MPRILRSPLLTLALTALVFSTSAFAHHSYSAYDTTTSVSIEGTVAKINFANPHVTVVIKTKDGKYSAEFPAVTVLQRANFTATSLHVGDVVVAVGRPMKDRSEHKMSLMMEIRRPSDGWLWTVGQQTATTGSPK